MDANRFEQFTMDELDLLYRRLDGPMRDEVREEITRREHGAPWSERCSRGMDNNATRTLSERWH